MVVQAPQFGDAERRIALDRRLSEQEKDRAFISLAQRAVRQQQRVVKAQVEWKDPRSPRDPKQPNLKSVPSKVPVNERVQRQQGGDRLACHVVLAGTQLVQVQARACVVP